MTPLDGVPVHQVGLAGAARRRAPIVAASFYPGVLAGGPVGDRVLDLAAGLYADGVAALLDVVRPDVVHATRIGRVHPVEAFAREAARRAIPFVLTPNHHPSWDRRRDRWWWDLYRRADAVLVLSGAERDALIAGGVEPSRIHRTTVGIVGAPPVTTPEQRGPVVAFLGQAHAYKGLDLLAAAWPDIRGAHPDAHLHVIGPWHGRPRLRQQLEDTAGVTVHGPVAEPDKWRLLAEARILAVPSAAESLGGVYLEAWAAGAVPVGADIPAVRELLAGTGGGRVVERTPAALLATITELLGDAAACLNHVAAGRRALDETYNWDRAAAAARAAYSASLEGSIR